VDFVEGVTLIFAKWYIWIWNNNLYFTK